MLFAKEFWLTRIKSNQSVVKNVKVNQTSFDFCSLLKKVWLPETCLLLKERGKLVKVQTALEKNQRNRSVTIYKGK